jgi:ATP-dependent RNA helicase DHX33
MIIRVLELTSIQVLIRPLYAALSMTKQREAFNKTPPNMRKCVLATNIAETSVTIPGIKFVIDCGICNEKRFLSRTKGSGRFDPKHTYLLTNRP